MNKSKTLPLFIFTMTMLFLLRLWFMLKANLLVEEAYYWNYSTHLDYSYLDHPPMVALLIKLGTSILHATEIGVRIATLPCWILTCYFSVRLTNLINKDAGWYAILFLSILPFFYIHSLIITPDIPLILSWAASLYYLYQALVLTKANSWYWAGFWLGIGLLSKYTIILVPLSTLFYLLIDKRARQWFFRKEPYYCALIAFILFTPVVYWNATHHWESFLFQSAHRFQDSFHFSFHKLIGLALIYLTPAGCLGLWILFTKKYSTLLPQRSTFFFQTFTLIPLIFFSLFSLTHGIKINWIGPIFLAIIPWLSLLITNNQQINRITFNKGWAISCVVIVIIYSCLLSTIILDQPKKITHRLFGKMLAWDTLTYTIYTIAQKTAEDTHSTPVLLPLDLYNIASELTFYQKKYFDQGLIDRPFPVVGAHVFGLNSLMYKYWGGIEQIKGKVLILISPSIPLISYALLDHRLTPLSAITSVSHSELKGFKNSTLYYQTVKMAAE